MSFLSENPKGLRVDIFRPASGRDCTNGGMSMLVSEVVVVCPELTANQGGIFEPSADVPAMALINRARAGRDANWVLMPIDPETGEPCTRGMAGGNLASTSDSRFRQITGGAVSIHDRIES